MKLYLVERTDGVDYDQYDSFVVAAESEDQAKKIKPLSAGTYGDWTTSYIYLKVTKIGMANKDTKESIILGSFNAG